MKTLQERLELIQEDKRRSEYNPYEIGALERYSRRNIGKKFKDLEHYNIRTYTKPYNIRG